MDQHAFPAQCTPRYYNFEGKPRQRSGRFGGGAVEFHTILRAFRNGDMGEVLGDPDS